VCLSEHYYVIEAIAADRSDKALRLAVLPGRPSGGRTVADSHRTNPAGICWTECSVTVADQVARRFIPEKSLCYLAGDPFRARMSGDAQPDQPPTPMTEDHQAIEQFEERGRHHKEVDRCNACRVVTQEGLPAL